MGESFSVGFSDNRFAWSIHTELPVGFELKYEDHIFSKKSHLLSTLVDARAVVVIDDAVYKIYKHTIADYFDTFGIELLDFPVQCNEDKKNLESASNILDFFENIKLKRRENIIAIGGGVLLDLVGFCASVYRRGIPYVKVPTTLLSIVDASVGSKVGINHFGKRNRLGAYYPPSLTVLDKSFVQHQDQREIINGLGEIFKLALIKSEELFILLETGYETLLREKFQYGALPVRVINIAITEMVDELAPNLWEHELKRCVDFGHIFSPLIEMNNTDNILHGEVVALDCLFCSCISYNRGLITFDILQRIVLLAKKLMLPISHRGFFDRELLIRSLEDSILHRNGNQFIPIPITIGNYIIINDFSVDEELDTVIEIFRNLSK